MLLTNRFKRHMRFFLLILEHLHKKLSARYPLHASLLRRIRIRSSNMPVLWLRCKWHLTFVIWPLTFNIPYLTFDIWHLTFDIWHSIFDILYLTFQIWYLTFDILQWTFDFWHSFFDIWNLIYCPKTMDVDIVLESNNNRSKPNNSGSNNNQIDNNNYNDNNDKETVRCLAVCQWILCWI